MLRTLALLFALTPALPEYKPAPALPAYRPIESSRQVILDNSRPAVRAVPFTKSTTTRRTAATRQDAAYPNTGSAATVGTDSITTHALGAIRGGTNCRG